MSQTVAAIYNALATFRAIRSVKSSKHNARVCFRPTEYLGWALSVDLSVHQKISYMQLAGILNPNLQRFELQLHCNLRPPDVAPVVLGCFGQICTAHAHKRLFPASD